MAICLHIDSPSVRPHVLWRMAGPVFTKKRSHCIFAMGHEDLSSLKGRFAPEAMAPFPSDKRVNSCARCAGMLGKIRARKRERERERTCLTAPWATLWPFSDKSLVFVPSKFMSGKKKCFLMLTAFLFRFAIPLYPCQTMTTHSGDFISLCQPENPPASVQEECIKDVKYALSRARRLFPVTFTRFVPFLSSSLSGCMCQTMCCEGVITCRLSQAASPSFPLSRPAGPGGSGTPNAPANVFVFISIRFYL